METGIPVAVVCWFERAMAPVKNGAAAAFISCIFAAAVLIAQAAVFTHNAAAQTNAAANATLRAEIQKTLPSLVTVRQALGAGADPDHDADGVPLLIVAATLGHADIVSVLVTFGANPAAVDGGFDDFNAPHYMSAHNATISRAAKWDVLRHFGDALEVKNTMFAWNAADRNGNQAMDLLRTASGRSGEADADPAVIREMADYMLVKGARCKGGLSPGQAALQYHNVCVGSLGMSLAAAVKNTLASADDVRAAAQAMADAGISLDLAGAPQEGNSGGHLLPIAAVLGRAEAVSILLTFGVNPGGRTQNDRNILHHAGRGSALNAPSLLRVLRYFLGGLGVAGKAESFDGWNAPSNIGIPLDLLDVYADDAPVDLAEKREMQELLYERGARCSGAPGLRAYCQIPIERRGAPAHAPETVGGVLTLVARDFGGAIFDFAPLERDALAALAASGWRLDFVSAALPRQAVLTRIRASAPGDGFLGLTVKMRLAGAADAAREFRIAPILPPPKIVVESSGNGTHFIQIDGLPAQSGDAATVGAAVVVSVFAAPSHHVEEWGGVCAANNVEKTGTGENMDAGRCAFVVDSAGDKRISVAFEFGRLPPGVPESGDVPDNLYGANPLFVANCLALGGTHTGLISADENFCTLFYTKDSARDRCVPSDDGKLFVPENCMGGYFNDIRDCHLQRRPLNPNSHAMPCGEVCGEGMLARGTECVTDIAKGDQCGFSPCDANASCADAKRNSAQPAEEICTCRDGFFGNGVVCGRADSGALLLAEVRSENGRVAEVLQVLRLLEGEDANPDQSDADGVAALIIAATVGHAEIVSVLLAAGANPAATDPTFDDYNVVHHMAAGLNAPAAGPRALRASVLYHFGGALAAGAKFDWNAPEANGARALDLLAEAARRGEEAADLSVMLEMSEYMIDRGAKCLKAENKTHPICLGGIVRASLAAELKKARGVANVSVVLSLLAQENAAAGAADADGVPLLVVAATAGHAEIVSVLVTAGADPNARLPGGGSPPPAAPHIAAMNGSGSPLRYSWATALNVLRHFTDAVSLRGADYDWTSSGGGNLRAIELLRDGYEGAEWAGESEAEKQRAIEAMTDILLENGDSCSDSAAGWRYHITCMGAARLSQHMELLAEVQNPRGSVDKAEVLRLLNREGMDPNYANYDEEIRSPLMIVAATIGHAEIVSVLITAGADPGARVSVRHRNGNRVDGGRAVPHLVAVNNFQPGPLYYSWETGRNVLRHFADAVNQVGAFYDWTSTGVAPNGKFSQAIDFLLSRYNHDNAIAPGENPADKKEAMERIADILLANGGLLDEGESCTVVDNRSHITCLGPAREKLRDEAAKSAGAANVSVVLNVLADGQADPNWTDAAGRPLLIAAARNGHAEIVSILVAAGADPNARDGTHNNYNVAHHAASPLSSPAAGPRALRASVLYYLGGGLAARAAKSGGASFGWNSSANGGSRPLDLLVGLKDSEAGSLPVIQAMADYMIARGASCRDALTAEQKAHAICVGSGGAPDVRVSLLAEMTKERGFASVSTVLRLLDEEGASPDFSDSAGRALLILAATVGHAEIVSVLITAGANPNALDPTFNNSDVAHHMSAPLSSPAVSLRAVRASVLRHFGDALEVRNSMFSDANFDWNRRNGRNYQALDILLNLAFDEAGVGAADMTVIQEMADYMVGRGAMCGDARTNEVRRRTHPLCIGAAAAADVTDARTSLVAEVAKARGVASAAEVARLLNADDADPNFRDDDGVPLLIVAALNGHAEIVSVLITAGADAATLRGQIPHDHTGVGQAAHHIAAFNNFTGRSPPRYPWATALNVLRHFADAVNQTGADYDWAAKGADGAGGQLSALEYLEDRHKKPLANWAGESEAEKHRAIEAMADILLAQGDRCGRGQYHVTCTGTLGAALARLVGGDSAPSAGAVRAAARAMARVGLSADIAGTPDDGHIMGLAGSKGYAEAVSVLLVFGADPDGRTGDNRSVLHHAAAGSGENAPVQLRLLRHFLGGLDAAGKAGAFDGWNAANPPNLPRPLDALNDNAGKATADKLEIQALLYERGARCAAPAGKPYCETPGETVRVPINPPESGDILTVTSRDFGGETFELLLPDAEAMATLSARGWQVESFYGPPRRVVLSRTAAAAALPEFPVEMLRRGDTVRRFRVSPALPTRVETASIPSDGGTLRAAGLTDGFVNRGEAVNLTATPTAGWYVKEWNYSDCANVGAAATPGVEQECILTADADLFVTVFFAIARTVIYGKDVSASLTAADGGGNVNSGDTFADGTTIAFFATPPENHQVARWTSNDAVAAVCAAEPACVLTVSGADLNVRAEFELVERTIAYAEIPDEKGGGTLTASVPFGGTTLHGSTVTFAATPAAEWYVEGWNDANCANVGAAATPGVEQECILTADADLFVTVTFAVARAARYEGEGLTAVLAADGGAVISGDTFADGTTIEFRATPPPDQIVRRWTNNGAGVGSCARENTCALAADGADLDVRVEFASAASANFSFYLPECDAAGTGDEHYPCPHAPGGSATIQALDSGGRVPVGTMVTLIARPDDGFYVEGWNHAACLATGEWQNAGAEKRCVLSATGDLNVTVTFALFSADGRSAHSRTSQVIVSYKGWTDSAARSVVRTGHILIRSGILEDLGVISDPPPTYEVEEVLAGIRMTLLGERRGLQVLRLTSTVPYFWGLDSATGKFADFTFSGVRRDSPLWSHLATVGVAAAVCDGLSDGWRIPSLSELAGMFSDGSGSIPLDRAAGDMELDQAVAGARSGMIIPLGRDVAAGDFAALSEGSTTYETASRNLDGVYKAARPVTSGAIRFPGAAGDRRMLCVRGEIAEGAHYMSAVRLESGGEIVGSPAATLRAQTVAFTVTTTLSATQFDGTDVFTGTVVSWRHKDAPEAMSNADAGVPSARTAGDWGGFALNSSPSPDGTGLQIQVRAPSTRPPPTGDNPEDLIRLSARLNPGVGATVTAVFMVKVESASVPAAPGSVFAALNADESVSLSWTPPAETGVTIIGYDILREQNGSDVFVSVGFSPGTGTIHTDASPPPLATLRYKTRARSTVDFGPASEASNPVETPQFFRMINYGALSADGAGGTVTVYGVESGESLPIGTTVTFAAAPAAGWYVEDWNHEDCVNDGGAASPGDGKECILTANTDLFVTAAFAVAREVVYGGGMSASLAADGGGTVSSGDTFADGTTIAFYAAPPENHEIAGWTNNGADVCEELNPCILEADADLNVSVQFALIPRTIIYAEIPSGKIGGTLTASIPSGEATPHGATVTFTAAPAAGCA